MILLNGDTSKGILRNKRITTTSYPVYSLSVGSGLVKELVMIKKKQQKLMKEESLIWHSRI